MKGRVRDLPEFRASLNVGIVKEESLDLNGDDNIDHVVYTNGGEETYLSVLLANSEGFAVWHFPVAEDYEIVRTGKRYEIILKFDTFPLFGSLYGSDQHQWFDYYEIDQDSVILANSNHKSFFESQRKLYRARLLELKERQRDHIDSDKFAFPKERKEPIHDASHVRNAIARFDQVEGVSDAEREAAWRRIKAAAKKFGVEIHVKSWRELM